MIEINLLPPQYQKKIKTINCLNKLMPYLFLGLLVILGFNLVLSLFIFQRKTTLNRIKSAWHKKMPFFQEINSLKENLSKLSQEYNSLRSIANSGYSFSELMYLIYTNLPINIWFKEITFKEGVLAIKGTVLDYQKNVSLSLKEFVDNLKKVAKITKVFPKIKIVSQEMRRIKDRRILYFELSFSK
ncbi:MAG: hypothetical protein DRP61_03910 [Candidatus Omnitrophota bacterium]|nr:MAG: hypothetical protein DRP61_03910 [Candidatus Omnitrophota bacterium]